VEAESTKAGRAAEGVVDDVVDPGLQLAQLFVGLRPGQHSVAHGLVEPLLRGIEQCLLEAVDGLVLRLRDLRERLAVEELRPELRRSKAEVVGRCGQISAEGPVEVAEAAEEARPPEAAEEARPAEPGSIAAALVASWSFWVEMPRCLATAARKPFPEAEEPFAAAIATVPPPTRATATTIVISRFDLSLFMSGPFVMSGSSNQRSLKVT